MGYTSLLFTYFTLHKTSGAKRGKFNPCTVLQGATIRQIQWHDHTASIYWCWKFHENSCKRFP